MSDLLLRLDYIKCDSVLFSTRVLRTGNNNCKNLDFILLTFFTEYLVYVGLSVHRLHFYLLAHTTLRCRKINITMMKNHFPL